MIRHIAALSKFFTLGRVHENAPLTLARLIRILILRGSYLERFLSSVINLDRLVLFFLQKLSRDLCKNAIALQKRGLRDERCRYCDKRTDVMNLVNSYNRGL